MQILIIGAGVSGLTTGVRLVEAGHEVVIWTREQRITPTPEVASTLAAAVWEPYAVEPLNRVLLWGELAYHEFERLAIDPRTGIIMRQVCETANAEANTPSWSGLVTGFHQRAEFDFRAPVIEMPIYLKYLSERFQQGHGMIVSREVGRLREVFAAWGEAFPHRGTTEEPQVVVNCTGLGALTFVDDRAIYGARGQIVRVEKQDFDLVLASTDPGQPPTYIVPRSNDIVLGGTFQKLDLDTLLDRGKYTAAVASDASQRTDILQRCAELALHFHEDQFAMSLAALVDGAFATTFRNRVRSAYQATAPAILSADPDGCGLRPCHRWGVQLRRERLAPDKVVIHNYGHGGAGVTLSWGCADEVLTLVGTA